MSGISEISHLMILQKKPLDTSTKSFDQSAGESRVTSLQCTCQLRLMTDRCDLMITKPTKNPKPNKNENHEKERSDPSCYDIPEWLQEFREHLVDDRVPEHRVARSARGPKLQGPHAEDAMAEPYLVQKILVT